MDKVQKYALNNTNTPLSGTYRSDSRLVFGEYLV